MDLWLWAHDLGKYPSHKFLHLHGEEMLIACRYISFYPHIFPSCFKLCMVLFQTAKSKRSSWDMANK